MQTMDRIKAREILEARISKGRASAVNLFERIENDVPTDALVKGTALRFATQASLTIALGDNDPLTVHRHAFHQLAQRASIPGQYLSDLATSTEGWERELASEILTRHYQNGHAATRFLVREVQGQIRGFLSDRYRRLDSRPLLEAFAIECQKTGAVPIDGIVTDTRVALKAIVPQVYEPIPGELMAFGVEWSNSDFGAGVHALRAFMLRVVCLNGATLENSLAQVHLGRQLSEDGFQLSERTYQLDTKTSISALRDVVGGVLSEGKIDALCQAVRQADEHAVEWRNVHTALGRRLIKSELEAVRHAFESQDVVNLPPRRSMWRASNALSWIAGNLENQDRKLELERLAGQMATGKRDELPQMDGEQ